MLLFDAEYAYAAPNKDTTILYRFKSPLSMFSPTGNGKILGIFKALVIHKHFLMQIFIFKGFQQNPSIFKYFSRMCKPSNIRNNPVIFQTRSESKFLSVSVGDGIHSLGTRYQIFLNLMENDSNS